MSSYNGGYLVSVSTSWEVNITEFCYIGIGITFGANTYQYLSYLLKHLKQIHIRCTFVVTILLWLTWPALHSMYPSKFCYDLTHWGRATHICVSKLTIIASDNGLSLGRRQAIIWNNVGILSIWLLGTNFSEILIEILTFSWMKMRLKVSSGKSRPFCLGLNELTFNCVQFFNLSMDK